MPTSARSTPRSPREQVSVEALDARAASAAARGEPLESLDALALALAGSRAAGAGAGELLSRERAAAELANSAAMRALREGAWPRARRRVRGCRAARARARHPTRAPLPRCPPQTTWSVRQSCSSGQRRS